MIQQMLGPALMTQILILSLLSIILIMRRLFSRPNYKVQTEEDKPSATAYLQLTVETWEKDSHGLFDYQTTKIPNKKFKVQGPCKIFRNWQSGETALVSLEQSKKGKIPNHTFSFVASLGVKQNGSGQTYLLHKPESPNNAIYKDGNIMRNDQGNEESQGPLNTNSYLVVKSLKPQPNKIKGHPLTLGNIIKLGRMEYLVIQYRNGVGKQSIKGSTYLLEENTHTVLEEYQGSCKICLEEETTPTNFLLSPCKCKGSCQLIHLQCLKNWINSKVKKEIQGIAATYSFSKFQCQLCKQPFPKLIRKGQEDYQMLQLQKPNKPYIMLQSMNQEKNLYLITADENVPIRLGRGHQCEIRMVDISVSRIHAEVKLIENNFYLCDYNSKFGTLIKLDGDTTLKDGMQVQCGRSLYTFNESGSSPKSSAYL